MARPNSRGKAASTRVAGRGHFAEPGMVIKVLDRGDVIIVEGDDELVVANKLMDQVDLIERADQLKDDGKTDAQRHYESLDTQAARDRFVRLTRGAPGLFMRAARQADAEKLERRWFGWVPAIAPAFIVHEVGENFAETLATRQYRGWLRALLLLSSYFAIAAYTFGHYKAVIQGKRRPKRRKKGS